MSCDMVFEIVIAILKQERDNVRWIDSRIDSQVEPVVEQLFLFK